MSVRRTSLISGRAEHLNQQLKITTVALLVTVVYEGYHIRATTMGKKGELNYNTTRYLWPACVCEVVGRGREGADNDEWAGREARGGACAAGCRSSVYYWGERQVGAMTMSVD